MGVCAVRVVCGFPMGWRFGATFRALPFAYAQGTARVKACLAVYLWGGGVVRPCFSVVNSGGRGLN